MFWIAFIPLRFGHCGFPVAANTGRVSTLSYPFAWHCILDVENFGFGEEMRRDGKIILLLVCRALTAGFCAAQTQQPEPAANVISSTVAAIGFRDKLFASRIGKSCIRFTNPDKIDFEVLKQLLRRTAKSKLH
jgi:hypothetical protein